MVEHSKRCVCNNIYNRFRYRSGSQGTVADIRMTDANIELLGKICCFTAESYIMMAQQESAVPKQLERLRLGIVTQRKFNPFTQEQAMICLEFGNDPELDKIMQREVSFTIFTLELMKIWTMTVPKEKRPYLGVSDKHFKLGASEFWKPMLQLKKTNGYKHGLKKEIIADSKEVAEQFFKYHWEKLNEKDT